MLIVSLWYHSRSPLCSPINDVKTHLSQHWKGRELNDAETALGIGLLVLCCSMYAVLCFLVSLTIWSSSPFIQLHLFLDCWHLRRVLTSFFISGSINFAFYIRNSVLRFKFLVAKTWQRAFFNHILLLQTISFTVAIILVKLIYYSNYGQFQVCYQVNHCSMPL